MSRCSSVKSGIVLVESKSRQIFYTLLVTSCSFTAGMCLEWPWYLTDEIRLAMKYRFKIIKSLLYTGAVISAGPAAFFASLCGLKLVLVIGMMITMCGSLVIIYLSYLTLPSSIAFCAGRIMHGIGTGIVFVTVPNYVVEMAEPKIRGMLTGLHNLNFISGMFLSHVANNFYVYWYVNMGTVVMSAINLLVLLLVDDPIYYRLNNEKQSCSALHSILIIQDYGRSNICNNVYASPKYRDSENSVALSNIFKEKRFYQPLLCNIFLIVFQQSCGFVILVSLMENVYEALHISETVSAMTAIISLQIISSLICMTIVGVLGKKNLLTISGFGMAIVLCLINVAHNNEVLEDDKLYLCCFTAIYIVFYSIGYGPIPWILMPEMCPRSSRLWTSGVTVSLFALFNVINNELLFTFIYYFDYYCEGIDIYGVNAFVLMITFVNVFGALFAHIFIPETKYCIKS